MNSKNIIKLFKTQSKCTSGRKLIIREKDPQSRLSKVELIGFESDNAIQVSLSQSCETCNNLKGGVHQKKCDAILFFKHKNEAHIVFIELKSTSIDRQKIKNQFLSTDIFIDYCGSILKKLYQDSVLEECTKHYVVIHYANPVNNKQPIVQTASQDSSISDFRKIPYCERSKHIRVAKLL